MAGLYCSSVAGPARPVRVLQVTSEMFPLAKTGGLADVCGALPKALASVGADTRVLMPAYPSALEGVAELRTEFDFGEVLGHPVRLLRGVVRDSRIVVWIVDCPTLYRRPGTPYLDADGAEWPDNAIRYAVLCHVAARLALGRAGSRWRPDVVHCHDWHAGLVPLLLRGAHDAPRSVFTVHNAAFQGNFPWDTAALLDLPHRHAAFERLEFHGRLSFLKCGLMFADTVTTVSPTYARELTTPEFGCGLEGLFASRGEDFVGILNGIDTEVWNPAIDRTLAERYHSNDVSGKLACKVALQEQLNLPRDGTAPLAIFASRVTTQKMADVLLASLPELGGRHPKLQFAMLGHGDRELECAYVELARAHPGRIAVDIGYRESTAHRLHAGADFLLHGSRFEPCGLAQLYAMRYGTVPIVRRVGGLADTVVDEGSPEGTGFVFDAATGRALAEAIHRCLALYDASGAGWSALRRRAMACDFGWRRSARAYLQLYLRLASGHSPGLDVRWQASEEGRGMQRRIVRLQASHDQDRPAPPSIQRKHAHA